MLVSFMAAFIPFLAILPGPPQDAQRVGRQWTLYNKAGGIEWQPLDLHVFQPVDYPVGQHPYGVARLDFLKGTAEYTLEFRVRFGRSGNVPARLELWSGDKRPFALSAGGARPEIEISAQGKSLLKEPLDDVWRSFKIVGNAETTRVYLYGKEIGSTASGALPDILVFGNWGTEFGRQTEAWLRMDRVTFRVWTLEERLERALAGSSELIGLRQRQGPFEGDTGWRWVAQLRLRNSGERAISFAELPELTIVTEDYREVRLHASGIGSATVASIEPKAIKPGESVEVEYRSAETSQASGARPVRAELSIGTKRVILNIPPP